MSFRSYASYKVQNFSARIPSHWDTKPFRFLTRCRKGRLPGNGASAYLSSGAIPYLSMEYLRGSSEPAMFIEPGPRELVAEANDILLLWDGSNAGEFLRAKRGVVSSTVSLVEPIGVERDFLFFACKAEEAQLKHLSVGMGIPHVSSAELGNIAIFLPPSAEQVCIAAFLDQETSKIDALISEQQRLIELLKEKRQAVISHAVTKGLNPDVRMKPSGVEWLGEVPEHWEVGPVKRFFSSLNHRRIPLSSEERSGRQGDYPYYGASGVIDYVDDFLFEEDLVLVSEDGANLVNRSTPISFVATGKYWVNNHAHIVKPPDSHVHFWAARLEAVDIVPFVTGSAQPKFTAEALQNLVISVPPSEDERLQIQNYLLSVSGGIDKLIESAAQAVALLQERRTALISAAVTGKIDVRNYAATQKDAA